MTSVPSVIAENAPKALVPIKSLRLSKRSAKAPPWSEKRRNGVN